ncbi:uncharacterized protein METZ01_LOCUS170513 [marine metagenome]|uniref:Uncharacterized protein n=1 Tax=marine metagenome TaxID=408172 RepID=A0A382BVM7_9ZZZZ
MAMRKKIKPARKTKTLTAAQKEAQRIRLEKMRAKKKPPEYKNVSKYVLSLDDEEPYSLKNVKDWIKHNKEMISMLQARARNRDISPKDKQHALSMADNKKAYIRYIEHYIKTGDWIGIFSGREEQNKVVPKCVAMAYYDDGTPKRSVGVFYPDIKAVWTQQMESGDIVMETIKRHRTATKHVYAKTDKQFTASL